MIFHTFMSREFYWRKEAIPTVTSTMTISRAWMEPTLRRRSRKVMGVKAERHIHTAVERRQRKYHTMGTLHPNRREDVS